MLRSVVLTDSDELPLNMAVPESFEEDENDAVVKLALQQYLHPLVQRGADVLILGCTHYALIKPAGTTA